MGELTNIKAGDKLILDGNLREPEIVIVEHVTPTGRIRIGGGYVFDKFGNRIGGDKWSTMHLEPISDAYLAKILRNKNLITIGRVNWVKLSNAGLERVLEIVREELTPKQPAA
jgi:hypothetical protein